MKVQNPDHGTARELPFLFFRKEWVDGALSEPSHIWQCFSVTFACDNLDWISNPSLQSSLKTIDICYCFLGYNIAVERPLILILRFLM